MSVFSTASVTMLAEIGGDAYYSLLLSLKGITVAVTCLLCGKLIDRLGRRNIMILGLLLQTITTAVTAVASNILTMLIARALFGIGYGFVCTAIMIMINELFASKSGYGYMITLLGYGAGNVGMPIIAAKLIEFSTWRMAFWFMAIAMLLSLILLVVACPNYTMDAQNSRLDVRGIVYFAVALCILVAILTFCNSYLPWSDPFTIILLVITVAALVLFVRHETRIDQSIAIFPMSMIRSKLVIGCAVGQLTMSINSTCLYAYIPYYMQSEMGATPTEASISTSIISFLTTVVGALMLIAMVKLQRHTAFGLFTVIGEAIALILVYLFLSPALSVTLLYALMIFYGLTQSVESYAFTMVLQNGLPTSTVAIGTALIQFVRQFTGVAATAIATPIINSSSDFGAGMKNVFLFAMIVTVLGAAVFAICVPGAGKAKAESPENA